MTTSLQLWLAAILLLLSGLSSARAYVHIGITYPVKKILKWPEGMLTYHYNDRIAAGTVVNLVTGSTPIATLEQAYALWNGKCEMTFIRGADSALASANGMDGVNLITFENTFANRSLVGSKGAVCILTFTEQGTIVDADTIFNPAVVFTTLQHSPDERQKEARPLMPSMVAMIAHSIALDKSLIASGVTFPLMGSRLASTEAGTLGTFLTGDDLIGANALYPDGTFFSGKGTIRGTISLRTTKVYGAHVVAVHADSGMVHAANLTTGNDSGDRGRYKIQGLPSGDYFLYAEPVDGMVNYTYWHGDYWDTPFDAEWQTTFYGGNSNPLRVTVQAGQEAVVSFAVDAGLPSMIPLAQGLFPLSRPPVPDATLWQQVLQTADTHTPLVLRPGERRWLAIAGVGLQDVSEWRCSDAAIQLDATEYYSGVSDTGLPFSVFRINVPDDAPAGPRNIVMRKSTEVATITGGIYIDPDKRMIPETGVRQEWIGYP